MPASLTDNQTNRSALTDPLGGRSGSSRQFGRLISQKIASESDTFYHHYDALGSTAAPGATGVSPV